MDVHKRLVGSITEANLDDLNWHRRQTKLNRLHGKEEAIKFEDELELNTFFQEHVEEVSEEYLQESEQKVKYLARGLDSRTLSNNVQEKSTSQFCEEFVAKYALEVAVEPLLEMFNDEKLDKEKLHGLLNSLLNEDEALNENTLSGYFAKSSLSIAQIYLLLVFLFDEIHKKGPQRKKLLNLLSGLITKLEHQESAYLFEFFSIAKHPSLGADLMTGDAMAKVAAGTTRLKNLRDTLDHVEKNFKGRFDNLVSNNLRYKSQILQRLTKAELSLEDKAELVEYLSFEKHIILVHSLYLQCVKFRRQLAENKQLSLALSNNYCNLIRGTLSLSEANLVTLPLVNAFLNQAGVGAAEQKNRLGILNVLINFLTNLPLTIFNDIPAQKQKVIHGLRNLARIDVKAPTANENKFSFLKKDNLKLINYI